MKFTNEELKAIGQALTGEPESDITDSERQSILGKIAVELSNRAIYRCSFQEAVQSGKPWRWIHSKLWIIWDEETAGFVIARGEHAGKPISLARRWFDEECELLVMDKNFKRI